VCPSKVLQNCARNQSGEQLRGDHGGEQGWRCRQIEAQLSPALKDYGAAGRSVFFSVNSTDSLRERRPRRSLEHTRFTIGCG